MGIYRFYPEAEFPNIDEKIIEEIVEIATLHYDNLSEEQKGEARRLSEKAGGDAEGKIEFKKYELYFKTKVQMFSSLKFFDILSKKNMTLKIHEFFAVHYLCACCRFCNQCNRFLGGAYFTCVECFNGSDDTYDICGACRKTGFQHKHAVYQFLDNYALLEAKRDQSSASQNKTPKASSSATTNKNPVLVVMQKYSDSK